MSESGEVLTPKEEVQIKVEMTARDAWLSITELCNLHKDPVAREFVAAQIGELWSMRTKISFLLSALGADQPRSAA